MASLRPIRNDDDPPAPSPIHLRALDDLRFIRETMERSGSFTAVSGVGELLVGVSALVAGYVAYRQPTDARWLTVWLVEALVAVVLTSTFAAAKASRVGDKLLSRPGKQVVGGLTPPLIAGLVLTVVLYANGETALLPGAWLLLYGTGVVTAGAFSVRIVPVMGVTFMAAGIVAFLTPGIERNIVLVAAFGVMHLIFGSIIFRRYGG